MKKVHLTGIFLGLFFLLSLGMNVGFAQEDPPPGDGDIPLDGGISILLIAGAAYGVKKVYNFESNKNEK